MKFIYLLRDNETGKEKTYDEDHDWIGNPDKTPYDTAFFLWSNGGLNCDCIRHQIFYGGEDEKPCNKGENRFELIRITEKESGIVRWEPEEKS